MSPHKRSASCAIAAVLLSLPALAADVAQERCEQIRARIGVAPVADAELLRSLAARRDCGFTAQEVYRAAHGDLPWLKYEAGERRRHDDEDHHAKHHDD